MIVDRDLDLREEMLELLKNTKYEILLQKTSRKVRCDCYNEKYQEANSKCHKCLGTGWLFRFEKHKTFKQDYTSSPDSAILFTEVGQLSHNYRVFYFAHDIYPQSLDYIWEVTWNKNRPAGLKTLYKIKEVAEQRGLDGKIEYFVALAKKETLDKEFKNHYIGKAWRDI